MKKTLHVLILLALLCPSALATSPVAVAAGCEAALDGEWRCVSGGTGCVVGECVTFGDADGERYLIGASAGGAGYLYYTDGDGFWAEVGEVTLSADGQFAMIYKSGSLAVLEKE